MLDRLYLPGDQGVGTSINASIHSQSGEETVTKEVTNPAFVNADLGTWSKPILPYQFDFIYTQDDAKYGNRYITYNGDLVATFYATNGLQYKFSVMSPKGVGAILDSDKTTVIGYELPFIDITNINPSDYSLTWDAILANGGNDNWNAPYWYTSDWDKIATGNTDEYKLVSKGDGAYIRTVPMEKVYDDVKQIDYNFEFSLNDTLAISGSFQMIEWFDIGDGDTITLYILGTGTTRTFRLVYNSQSGEYDYTEDSTPFYKEYDMQLTLNYDHLTIHGFDGENMNASYNFQISGINDTASCDFHFPKYTQLFKAEAAAIPF